MSVCKFVRTKTKPEETYWKIMPNVRGCIALELTLEYARQVMKAVTSGIIWTVGLL